jgi:hypothetical protein
MKEEILRELFPSTVEAQKKATEILRKALKDKALMDSIQERACIRWSDGYSDSLYSAVLSNIASTEEMIERDNDGNIILKPKTDWKAELSKYR